MSTVDDDDDDDGGGTRGKSKARRANMTGGSSRVGSINGTIGNPSGVSCREVLTAGCSREMEAAAYCFSAAEIRSFVKGQLITNRTGCGAAWTGEECC